MLRSDLYEVMMACTRGELSEQLVQWSSNAATTVVMAAPGYPAKYDKGIPITGLSAAMATEGVTVYHAGTKKVSADSGAGGANADSQFVSSGGRVLTVTGVGANLGEAIERAYAGVKAISFECEGGAMFRTDIAAKAKLQEQVAV